jgi:hypothetical protein
MIFCKRLDEVFFFIICESEFKNRKESLSVEKSLAHSGQKRTIMIAITALI